MERVDERRAFFMMTNSTGIPRLLPTHVDGVHYKNNKVKCVVEGRNMSVKSCTIPFKTVREFDDRIVFIDPIFTNPSQEYFFKKVTPALFRRSVKGMSIVISK